VALVERFANEQQQERVKEIEILCVSLCVLLALAGDEQVSFLPAMSVAEEKK